MISQGLSPIGGYAESAFNLGSVRKHDPDTDECKERESIHAQAADAMSPMGSLAGKEQKVMDQFPEYPALETSIAVSGPTAPSQQLQSVDAPVLRI